MDRPVRLAGRPLSNKVLGQAFLGHGAGGDGGKAWRWWKGTDKDGVQELHY
jgi:hypothetical protein